MSDSLVTPTKASSRTRVVEGVISMTGEQISAPLLMETIIEVEIMGEQLSIVLEATGTIVASIEYSPSPTISHAKVVFDTASFVKTLMVNARDSVKYATKRLFEIFLSSSNNIQHSKAMDSQMVMTDNEQRSTTGDDEKEGDSPRLSPVVTDMSAHKRRVQSKMQLSYLSGKSLSGVDLLKMAAECLS